MDLKRFVCAGLASVFGLSCLGLSGCANLADSKAGSTAAGAGAGAALGAVISSATGGHHRGVMLPSVPPSGPWVAICGRPTCRSRRPRWRLPPRVPASP